MNPMWQCCCGGAVCPCKSPYIDALGFTHRAYWDVSATVTPASCATIKTLAVCPTADGCTGGFAAASSFSYTHTSTVVPNYLAGCNPYVSNSTCCGMTVNFAGPTVNYHNWYGDCCNSKQCTANGGACCQMDPQAIPLYCWQGSITIRFPDPAYGFNKWQAVCTLQGLGPGGNMGTATYELNTTSCNINGLPWTLVSHNFTNSGAMISGTHYWVDGVTYTLGGFQLERTP